VADIPQVPDKARHHARSGKAATEIYRYLLPTAKMFLAQPAAPPPFSLSPSLPPLLFYNTFELVSQHDFKE
jgi:hypothetical protein